MIELGVEAVESGILHKDCENGIGNCLGIVLLEYAFFSEERQTCMPLLCHFFE